MVYSLKNSMNESFFLESLQRAPRRAFDVLCEQKWIRDEGWSLSGSAAWVVQLGHRKADDLDYVVDDALGDTKKLGENLKKCRFTLDNSEDGFEDGNSINAHFRGAPVRFYAHSSFIPLHEKILVQNTPVIHIDDLAFMTLIKIGEQIHKHDLVDLCCYLKKYSLNLEEFVSASLLKYPQFAEQIALGVESLTDFDAVEDEPMPRMSIKLSWDSVQAFLINQTTFHNHTPELH